VRMRRAMAGGRFGAAGAEVGGARIGRINVTPMIDVIMVLIVFYLIVGKLAGERRSAMDLPRSVAGVASALPESVFVNVAPIPAAPAGARPIYTVDREVVAPSQLPAAIERQLARRPGATLHIRADRSLPYSAVAPVIEAARAAGAGSVRLATQREGAGATVGGGR
jgi:biopolymer transport protein ExbD